MNAIISALFFICSGLMLRIYVCLSKYDDYIFDRGNSGDSGVNDDSSSESSTSSS